jgi:hypothetical protein
MICRTKCLSGGVGFDNCFAIAYRLRVDDAIQPVLDSVEKLDKAKANGNKWHIIV